MKKYYVSFNGGKNCIIIEAPSAGHAIEVAIYEYGNSASPFYARVATAEDMAWFEAMR